MKWAMMMLIAFILLYSCKSEQPIINHEHTSVCPVNIDSLYDRNIVLQVFADTLNGILSHGGFKVSKRGTGGGFMVFDLVDTANHETVEEECIHFINNHIYHFSSVLFEESFSNIAYLEDGKIKIFTAINCVDRGNSIDDVLDYLKLKPIDNNKNEVLKRVRNYRQYGFYVATDPYAKLNVIVILVNSNKHARKD